MVLEKLFLVLFVEQQMLMMKTLMRKKKTIIFNQVHRFLGEETQAYTVQGTTWKHKNYGYI